MKRIKIYKPPDGPAPAAEFIDGLEPKLRDKVVRQILYLSWTPLPGVEGAPLQALLHREVSEPL